MCGRFVMARASSDLVPLFELDEVGPGLPDPSYNIAPTHQIGIIVDTKVPAQTRVAASSELAPNLRYDKGIRRPIEGASRRGEIADHDHFDAGIDPRGDEPFRVRCDAGSGTGDRDLMRRIESARWGLVPRFKKSLTDGPTPFNARSETVATSGMFRAAFARRRAIIPADGFYERCRSGDRQSFFIHPSDGDILAFAGVYEWWRDPTAREAAGAESRETEGRDGRARRGASPSGGSDPETKVIDPREGSRGGLAADWILSATILTRPAQGGMIGIHDREPLYLPRDLWADWLDPTVIATEELLQECLGMSSLVEQHLEYRKIGPGWLSSTGSRHRDDPGLLA